MGAFKCPGCGTTTLGNLKCCPKCGEPLTRTCPDCGGTWRYIYDDDYQYCPSCGAHVTRPK
ncbi:MAG: double zinc ribbon domain-containing protein [Candidatus Methylomirabilales bacterium]